MTSTYKLVLNGIAVTAGLHALQILLIVGLDPTRFQQINTWLIGSIFGNSWTHVDILFLIVLLITFFFLASHETLDLLALREENARLEEQLNAALTALEETEARNASLQQELDELAAQQEELACLLEALQAIR